MTDITIVGVIKSICNRPKSYLVQRVGVGIGFILQETFDACNETNAVCVCVVFKRRAVEVYDLQGAINIRT